MKLKCDKTPLNGCVLTFVGSHAFAFIWRPDVYMGSRSLLGGAALSAFHVPITVETPEPPSFMYVLEISILLPAFQMSFWLSSPTQCI